MKSKSLAILLSHPIQYYSPWFRDLASRIDFEVLYSHRQDAKGQADAGFGVSFEWDVPLFEGYSYRWLKNVSRKPSISGFWGCDNPELANLIGGHRYKALLVVGWNRKSCWQAMTACWKHGVPLLMRGDSQMPMVQSRLKRAIKAAPYRAFLNKIDGHLYPGIRNREYLKSFGVADSKLFWCPHFIDGEFFANYSAVTDSDEEIRRKRAEFGIPSDAFVVMFVGKLIDKKRPLDFVSAVRRAASKSKRIHGIVVGSGPLEDTCKQYAAESSQIHFAGFQNQTQLPLYYHLADALVLPSDGNETWGLVANEAMACGRPCIVSSACGCGPDLIEDAKTGFVYSLGDVRALANSILTCQEIVESSPEALRLPARRKSEQFSIESASLQLLKALKTVAPGVCA